MNLLDYLREFHNNVLTEMKRGFAQQFEGKYRYCITVSEKGREKGRNKESRRLGSLFGKKAHDVTEKTVI